MPIAVIEVESAVKYSFVYEGIQTRQKGQYKADLTLSPGLHVEPLITAITATNRLILIIDGNQCQSMKIDDNR